MKLGDYLKNRAFFWVMHLTYDGEEGPKLWKFGKENRIIGLDRSDVNQNWNSISQAQKLAFFWNTSRTWYRQFEDFCNRMEKDDLVTVLEGQKSVLGIARVLQGRGEYYYRPQLKTERVFFDHVKDVEWKKVWDYDSKDKPEVAKAINFSCTIQRAPKDGKFWKALSDINW